MKLTWTIQSIHSLILCIDLFNLFEKVIILTLTHDINLTSFCYVFIFPLPYLILIFKDEIFLGLFVKLNFFRLFLVYWWRAGIKRSYLLIISIIRLTTLNSSKWFSFLLLHIVISRRFQQNIFFQRWIFF